MLSIFDEILYCLVHMAPNCSITPQDAADITPVSVSLLIVVAAVDVALAMRDVLPQLAELNGLEDVSTHLIAIKEVSSMDVVAPTIIPVSLFDRINVADEVVKDRITLVLGNQLIQVIKDMFHS